MTESTCDDRRRISFFAASNFFASSIVPAFTMTQKPRSIYLRTITL